MIARVAILIPSFGRPDSVTRVLASLRDATPGEGDQWAAYVVAELADTPTIEAAQQAGVRVILNKRTASYAGAINTAYEYTREPILFTGADDLAFHEGWLQAVFGVFETDPAAMVVGTNDLANPYVLQGTHATHYALLRDYVAEFGGSADGPGSVLHEGYDHQFTDSEAVAVARHRGVFRPCMAAVVEHLHVLFGKSEWDATYDKGHARYAEDTERYHAREHLWGGPAW